MKGASKPPGYWRAKYSTPERLAQLIYNSRLIEGVGYNLDRLTEILRRKMDSVLEREYETYLENKEDLLEWHEGKYALIKEDQVLAVYNEHSHALRDGYAVLGNVPFLIHEINPIEPVIRMFPRVIREK